MKNNVLLKIYRKKTIEKLDAKVKQLGSANQMSTIDFLNIRMILTVLTFVCFLIFSKYGFILAPVLAIVVYILMETIGLDYQLKKRAQKLEKEALFFFEVLALTLEGGRSLKQSLEIAVENLDSEIALEFKKTLTEVRMGKSLNEGLEAMKKRIPSETINNTILNMIQTNTFGTNILDSMYNQIEFLRDKQILDVKAEIAKLPTKVSIISVLFFVPIMLLIILAPVLISYLAK